MKKAIFFTSHFLPHLGGVEKHVSQIARVLSNRDWEIEVVTVQEDNDQPLYEDLKYCTVTRIPIPVLKSKLMTWQWIKNYFKKISPDTVVHIHDVGWWLLPQLIFNKKNNFYITFHGWEGQYPIRWQAKLHRLFISLLVKKSIHVGSFIQKFYWDKPDSVIYGGVKLPVEATTLIPEENNLHIVFLGRLEQENSVTAYIEVLTELAKLKIKTNVTWVGDGSFRTMCEKWGKVTGMVTDTKTYISKAEIVFASSYLSLLESQALGKVVCALYDNPLKKVYLETYPGSQSMLVAGNSQVLASQINGLMHDKHIFSVLSKKSSSFAQQQTWNYVADVYEDLWSAA